MKRLYVLGRGRLGRRLVSAARMADWQVSSRAGRRSMPRRIEADLLVLAVRDGQLKERAAALLGHTELAVKAVVHCAGSVDVRVLDSLRHRGLATGQMHPLLSLGPRVRFRGGYAVLQGDPIARRWAARLAQSLGLKSRCPSRLDAEAYHAAAALLANGAIALAHGANDLMREAGLEAPELPLARLLQSVAENLASEGLPEALTGPIRRGDAATVKKHLRVLGQASPATQTLYRASAGAQLSLARRLAEASVEEFDAIEKMMKSD